METATTAELRDIGRATEFYEARYEAGYMEDYSPAIKQRITDIIRSAQLPSSGAALDFGCGNGVLTEVMRSALPGWRVYGAELSKQAIQNARSRFPACTFLELDDPALASMQFDFLFSHHVLEHVSDLSATADQIGSHLSTTASMLHVLPCGNAGSYEYRLCALRKDGFNPQLGNRFFFEDEGHLRRLTTDQLRDLFSARGFTLEAGYYTHQYDGAIEWLTNLDRKSLRALTDFSEAKDFPALVSLAAVRLHLLAIAAVRRHARLSSMLLRERKWTLKRIVAATILLPFFPLTRLVAQHIEGRAAREWKRESSNPAGSEMALYFVRLPSE